jgi:hypothetical protein
MEFRPTRKAQNRKTARARPLGRDAGLK